MRARFSRASARTTRSSVAAIFCYPERSPLMYLETSPHTIEEHHALHQARHHGPGRVPNRHRRDDLRRSRPRPPGLVAGRGRQPPAHPVRDRGRHQHARNFFDTANLYSSGSSEEFLGRALHDFANRDEVVIATKLRHPMRPGPNGGGLSRKEIMTEVDHSLRRLGTDYIDLYQIHRNDPATPLEETLEALSDLVRAGKVRYLGASSMHAWEFAKALHLQRQNGWARFVSMQDHYNLLQREEEREMIPLCLDEGVGA